MVESGMRIVAFIAIWLCLVLATMSNADEGYLKTFPTDFGFGVSTSAYQIEGGWDADGKGLSIWDNFCHNDPDVIHDGTNGDVADRSYYEYKRDVEMLKELGVKYYRFSISWTRILPQGRGNVNPLGIAYYNNLIDELIKNDIEPLVTMYHWDLPQTLSELGGWLNEDIVDWFGEYSRVLYENFGDRIKKWMTVNEPHIHCYFAYDVGTHAPGHRSPGVGFYECGRNMLLANAKAYHIYTDEFKISQKGIVGIPLDVRWAEPQSNSTDDVQAAEDYIAFFVGQYMEPIFGKEGNYPQRMIDRVADASAQQGLNSSRLRPFTKEQINSLKGSADFVGINHYSSRIVYRNASLYGKYEIPSLYYDGNFGDYLNHSWPISEIPWMREYSPGFYKILMHVKEKYNNPKVYITENGFPTATGLNDDSRIHYFRSYWSALLDALRDGCNIKGYFVWSLMDNFEWAGGYTHRFGLYEVDFHDPHRRRTPRKSAYIYKHLIKTRSIDYSYDVDPYAADRSLASNSSPRILLLLLFILSSVVLL